MMKVLSSEQIKNIEKLADESGITYLRLMENAGSACAKLIRTKFDDSGLHNVTVICGKGKNGGDGFVIARKLFENGYKVNVILAMGKPVADISLEMFSRLEKLGVDIRNYDPQSERQAELIRKSDLVVDCVFGTGFSGVAQSETAGLFECISTSDGFVISIDLPSGMCADESSVEGAVVKADMTISIMALKYSLVYYPSAKYAGDIKVVSIGVPEEMIMKFQGGFSLSEDDIKARFHKRDENSNKGDFGKALIIAGSYEMPGAALLSSAAAVSGGAGLVKLAFPDKAYSVMMNMTPEKILVPLQSNRYGRISALATERILEELKKCSAVLVGCGMGNDYDTAAIVKAVLENAEVPVVLDADGINAVCNDISIIRNSKAPVIITPHPGEAARLLGCDVEKIESNRVEACMELFKKTGATVILKGSRTLVTANGKDFYINMTGNAGMATGGSGDVLAGLVLSFLCQKMKPFSAAVAGTFVHGMAGDAVAERYSLMGTTPTKIIEQLGKTLSEFE